MNRCEKRKVYFLIAVLMLLFSNLSCSGKKEEMKAMEQGVPVLLGEASIREVKYILDQVGTLEATREVTMRSETEGKVVKILFEEGREVEKGDILVQLNSTKIEADIRGLEARINQLEIRLDNRERNLERNRALVDEDLVSRQQFDDLQSEIKEIRAQIVQTKADLARQKERLADTLIRAPFGGVAEVRNFSVGHYVKVGDPLVSIVTLHPLEITFSFPEKLKSRIFGGQDVSLTTDAYPDQIFNGKIFFISPQVDLDKRSFQVKARIENDKHLLNPGMFARVVVFTEVHEKAVTVPWESVIQTEEGSYIYIAENGVAKKTMVILGKVTEKWAEVLNPGFSLGAKVILEGKFAVKDGMKININNPKPMKK